MIVKNKINKKSGSLIKLAIKKSKKIYSFPSKANCFSGDLSMDAPNFTVTFLGHWQKICF